MKGAGFEELDHTADWALRVWGPTLPALLHAAVGGMYSLSGVRLGSPQPEKVSLRFPADDTEMLLVDFLSELVFLGEDGLGVESMNLVFSGGVLRAELTLAAIASQKKEIKAVTYHGLAVKMGDEGYEATLVFDV